MCKRSQMSVYLTRFIRKRHFKLKSSGVVLFKSGDGIRFINVGIIVGIFFGNNVRLIGDNVG